MSYLLRFEHSGEIDDVEKALQRSLDAVPLLGSDAFLTLGNLVTVYRHRYYRLQDPRDLWEAEKCGLQALQKSPPSDPGKFITLNNLAGIMGDRFEYFGKMEYLENAISYGRQSLSLCPPDHPEENLPTMNLALMLSARFELLGEKSDMEESSRLAVHALSLCPPGHPKRERCLRTLVISCKRFWLQTRDVLHLDRAIQYARDALPLYATGSFEHPRSREYLGIVLYDRFLKTRQRSDLEESVRLHRAALALCPDSSYDRGMFQANLGAVLAELFDLSNDPTDLDEAIAHYLTANEAIDIKHPLKPTLQSGLALAYLRRPHLPQTQLSDAFALLQSASNSTSAGSNTQFDAALRWVFAARAHKHPSIVDAFSRLLVLLELRLLAKETIPAQQEFLQRIPFRELASEVAASAIEDGKLNTAVELLEQGRTMLWSRMRGYRHPINSLRAVDASLADRFQTVSAELEHTSLALQHRFTSFSSTTGNKSPLSDNSIDSRLRHHRILSENWTEILNEIRAVEGFAAFLLTPSFETLRTVAEEGPVVLFNIGEGRCDAIITHKGSPLRLVQLPESSPSLLDHLAAKLRDISRLEHDFRARGLTMVLRELWRAVVHPVVEVLLSTVGVELKSRIWWCPTAQLCALPIHAAGPYTHGQRNLPDIFCSSYTPTLNALITARAGSPSTVNCPRLLVIGQPDTLPMVEKEIQSIQAMHNFSDVLLGAHATADSVLSELRTHPWIHFACHGSHHYEPFKSAFELYKGDRISVLDIARANLPSAQFAFLSACHTAASDIGTPDEFITLAAALQFAGFRGVVSTFWDMADEDGPQTSGDFYNYMFRQGSVPDSRDAAAALNSAVRLMRRRNVPLYRWANFIHIGI
ncbi:CHAT domain-containing protein [Mycena filopes]|nr:CHAT domain-containing protein [Mycena filopes]